MDRVRRSIATVAIGALVFACLPKQDLDGYETGDISSRPVEAASSSPPFDSLEPMAPSDAAPPAQPSDVPAGIEKSGAGGPVVLQDGQEDPVLVPSSAVDAGPSRGADAGDAGDGAIVEAGVVVALDDACDGPGEVLGPAGEACYFFSSDARSWAGAREACLARSSELGALTSLEEDAFVSANVAATVWIGANDRQREGVFVWDSGEAFEFTRFALGEPDDLLNLQDCVEKRGSDGLWLDRDCDLERRYVCERRLGARALSEG